MEQLRPIEREVCKNYAAPGVKGKKMVASCYYRINSQVHLTGDRAWNFYLLATSDEKRHINRR